MVELPPERAKQLIRVVIARNAVSRTRKRALRPVQSISPQSGGSSARCAGASAFSTREPPPPRVAAPAESVAE
jgi:hypothetical protein